MEGVPHLYGNHHMVEQCWTVQNHPTSSKIESKIASKKRKKTSSNIIQQWNDSKEFFLDLTPTSESFRMAGAQKSRHSQVPHLCQGRRRTPRRRGCWGMPCFSEQATNVGHHQTSWDINGISMGYHLGVKNPATWDNERHAGRECERIAKKMGVKNQVHLGYHDV